MKTVFVIFFILISTSLNAAIYEVDEVRVYKTKHKMEMLYQGNVTKVYTVMLGRGGMAPKKQEGDKLVPEGQYILDYKNPYSNFYRSIHLTYPNPDDIKRAQEMGVNPGFDIFIHGMPKWYSDLETILDERIMNFLYKKKGDWTAGCIAVQNYEMQEIWDNVEVPTPITIYHD